MLRARRHFHTRNNAVAHQSASGKALWVTFPVLLDKAPDVGLVISAVSALIGTFVLPFAVRRVKWLPFVSCLLNASGIAFLFFASIE
jgi:hypothetical protein